jgi:hypothetical protein
MSDLPNAAFVATRTLTINGVVYAAGDRIATENMSRSRLQQLFNLRRITPVELPVIAPVDAVEPVEVVETTPDPVAKKGK